MVKSKKLFRGDKYKYLVIEKVNQSHELLLLVDQAKVFKVNCQKVVHSVYVRQLGRVVFRVFEF